MKKSLLFALILMLVCVVALSACKSPSSTTEKPTELPSETISSDELPSEQPSDDVPQSESTSNDDQPTECQHTYGDWVVTKEATCTEAGAREKVCTLCSDKQTETVDALGHAEVIDNAVPATCTEAGWTEGKHCSVCNTTIMEQKTVDALGHTEVIDNAVPATCTEAGLTEGKHCSECGEVLTEQKTAPATGHTIVTTKEVLPTCTESGQSIGKHCDVCGEVFIAVSVIDAKGHTAVVDDAIEPTCTKTGLTEGSHCSDCGKTILPQSSLPATGHTVVTDKPVEATCTKNGLTEGKHCVICKTVVVKQTVVPATGHTVVVDKAVAPSCEAEGLTEGKHCSVCAAVLVKQEVVKATGHLSMTLKGYAATCTDNGLTDGKRCSVCHKTTEWQKTIAATGHTWSDWTIEGYEKYKVCLTCSEKKQERLPYDPSKHTPIEDPAILFHTYSETTHELIKAYQATEYKSGAQLFYTLNTTDKTQLQEFRSYLILYYGQWYADQDCIGWSTLSNSTKIYKTKVYKEYEETRARCIQKADEILAGFHEGTDEEILMQIANYLDKTIKYNVDCPNLYDALFTGEASCNGHALAFRLLATRAGIRCDIITGETDSGGYHAWNVAYINGEERFFDITFYDKVLSSKWVNSTVPLHNPEQINNYRWN